MATLSLRRPGLLTTIQDLGRRGHGRFGVSPSGAMDSLALRIANRLVGNHDASPALEITAIGPEVEFLTETTFSLAGANLSPSLNGLPLEVWRSHAASPGDVLSFGARRQGARCYLALAGGIDCPAVFGSAATDLEAGIGGIDGAPLGAGQRLSSGATRGRPAGAVLPGILRAYASPFELRFVPEASPYLGGDVLRAFAGSVYRIAPRSNRMGYRLLGPALPSAVGTMLSEPVPPGAIQLPPDGQPIVLMADRPTVGGYPRLGAVIAADAPKTGQLWLGHEVRFRAVSLDEAHAALTELEEWLERAVPR